MIEADILREAATLIRRTGKTEHGGKDDQGRICAMVALQRVCDTLAPRLWGVVYWATKDTLVLEGIHPADNVGMAGWSDDIAKDAEDVAVIFEKTAARLEEQEGL